MKKLKRFLVAVLLLPVCYGATFGLWEILRRFQDVPEGSVYFLAGVATYFAFQWVFFRPIRTYVFGHELSHAIAAWVTGAEVKHFHVSKKGGSVRVSKSNFFIALAPYVLPLYALFVMAAYYALCYFYPSLKAYWRSFLWLLGGSLGFHMALTAYALKMDQPDLKAAGRFLSAVIIYLGNTVSIVFLLGVLFPRTVSWVRFARVSGAQAFAAVKNVGQGIRDLPPMWGKVGMGGKEAKKSTPHPHPLPQGERGI
jgi:peptidase M50B-like protein